MAPSTQAPNPTTHVLKKSSIVKGRMTMMGKKVRVIAKIRSSTDLEKKGIPWISVNKPKGDDVASQRATVTFEGQPPSGRKESYELDFCYDQSDSIDLIFPREVKPLISELFDGRDATVIACGARGSGKTRTIQGTDEQPGLAVLALEELLSSAPIYGKSIAISLYEIDHEHVYDLLPPKRQQVLVLKDGQGKIQLKGLSQVVVASPSQIHKLYSNFGSRKTMNKIAHESPNRSHIGLTIHVLSPGGKLNTSVTKINFIDLSGYEDPRRKSTDGINLAENAKINKSIYALQNVLYNLSANEGHVPFRESKVTHMLQDSLGGESKILMITCLNPSFCQDSAYMMNLASRCCQGMNRAISDSTKKSSSSVKPMVSSHKTRLPWSVSSTMKKQIRPQMQLSRKKGNCPSSALKERKLFDEGLPLNDIKACSSKSAPTIESSLQEEACSSPNIAPTIEFSGEEEGDTSLLPPDDGNSVPMLEGFLLPVSNLEAANLPNKDVFSHPEPNEEEDIHSSVTKSFSREGEKEDKENNNSSVNATESPPISTRLQELSNNLKLLYSSIPPQGEMAPPTPSYQDLKSKNETFDIQTSTDLLEPITPDQNVKINDKEILSFHSPWETLHARSFGPKNSLVQEYLKFLNSASKEELKKLKGIGEKRATYILELREETPVPFKELDDLKDIGLSSKQIKGMMEKEVGGLFK